MNNTGMLNEKQAAADRARKAYIAAMSTPGTDLVLLQALRDTYKRAVADVESVTADYVQYKTRQLLAGRGASNV